MFSECVGHRIKTHTHTHELYRRTLLDKTDVREICFTNAKKKAKMKITEFSFFFLHIQFLMNL